MFFLTVKVQMSNSCSKNRWEWQIKAYIQHKVHNFVTRNCSAPAMQLFRGWLK
uniref:Uncharacterized protein n=1 Tax=Anguilla anguilla TaxID=7936 RepID=A0A0E9Q5I1_ANGAN